MAGEINVLALLKERDRYIFLYDAASEPELLALLGRYAADPELDFTWYDAAVLSQRVRQLRTPSDAGGHGWHRRPSTG